MREELLICGSYLRKGQLDSLGLEHLGLETVLSRRVLERLGFVSPRDTAGRLVLVHRSTCTDVRDHRETCFKNVSVFLISRDTYPGVLVSSVSVLTYATSRLHP